MADNKQQSYNNQQYYDYNNQQYYQNQQVAQQQNVVSPNMNTNPTPKKESFFKKLGTNNHHNSVGHLLTMMISMYILFALLLIAGIGAAITIISIATIDATNFGDDKAGQLKSIIGAGMAVGFIIVASIFCLLYARSLSTKYYKLHYKPNHLSNVINEMNNKRNEAEAINKYR